jgi:hypothetical protein
MTSVVALSFNKSLILLCLDFFAIRPVKMLSNAYCACV